MLPVCCFYRFTSTRYTKPVKDATQSMNNAAVTYQDGVLTLSFERALDTGDDEDLSFSDHCYYFIFPVGGGPHSNNDFSQHSRTPDISPKKICIGKQNGFEVRSLRTWFVFVYFVRFIVMNLFTCCD